MFGGTAILVGAFFLNSLYLQHAMDASALETGLGFLPIAVAIAVSSHGASHALGHAGSRAVAVLGLLMMGGAAGLLATVPGDASYWTLLPGFVMLGLGAGFALPAASVTAMSGVAHEGAGLAAGLMSTAHEVGAALGVAVLSAIAAASPASDLASGYTDAFTAAAAIAAALAVVAALALPAVRPPAGARVGVH
jgi:MFS family permease